MNSKDQAASRGRSPLQIDQLQSDADQASSGADQAASDADQTASGADAAASRAAQQRADLDQRASDADQAAADHDAGSGPRSRVQLAVYEQGRRDRENTTLARRATTSWRAESNARRVEHGAGRDEVAQTRDETGLVRDGSAELRDRTAARLEREAIANDRASRNGLREEIDRGAALRVAAAANRSGAADARRVAAAARARSLIELATAAIEHSRREDETGWPSDGLLVDPVGRGHFIRELLPGAQERGELSVDYQPLYDLRSGAMLGVEALMRWTTDALGRVAPDEFIPEAERTGQIVALGEWVLHAALRAVAEWRGSDDTLTVAVNIAPEQLCAGFVELVADALDAAGVPAEALTLEVTERTFVADHPRMQAVSEALRDIGVRLSVDDFGTGFSSLGRLTHLGLDELKIDRIFVTGVETDRRQRALIAGILAMSEALGLRVVAEGIETAAQRDVLIELGCRHGQGYLLSRPIGAHAISELVTQPAAVTSKRS